MVKDEILKIIKKYINALKVRDIHPEKFILFGSYTGNTFDEWSDIDIAVVSRKFGKDRFQERIRLAQIASEIDPRIEPHPFGLNEFEEETWKTMIHEIKATGIEVAA